MEIETVPAGDQWSDTEAKQNIAAPKAAPSIVDLFIFLLLIGFLGHAGGHAATFSLRQHRHAALRAAPCAPSVALDAVLFVPSVVPDAVRCAPCVVPDAAPYLTAVSQWKALLAWSVRLRSEHQHLTPSE